MAYGVLLFRANKSLERLLATSRCSVFPRIIQVRMIQTRIDEYSHSLMGPRAQYCHVLKVRFLLISVTVGWLILTYLFRGILTKMFRYSSKDYAWWYDSSKITSRFFIINGAFHCKLIWWFSLQNISFEFDHCRHHWNKESRLIALEKCQGIEVPCLKFQILIFARAFSASVACLLNR